MRALIPLALLLAGCGTLNAAYDGDINCKGKVALSITGNLQVGAGYGGGGTNVVNIVGDCGEGFSLVRSKRSGDAVILQPVPTDEPQPRPIVPQSAPAPLRDPGLDMIRTILHDAMPK